MKPIHLRIQDLQKEVANLTALRDEARSEMNSNMDESLYYLNQANEAEKRMHARQDELEARMVEIGELEEQEAQVHAASA